MLRKKQEDKPVAVVRAVSDLATKDPALLDAILRECRTCLWPARIDLHRESRSETQPPQSLDRVDLLQWVARVQTLESVLTFRLRAAGEPVSPASLVKALTDCTEADLRAMLLLDEVAAGELAALRELVHVRLNLSTRKPTQAGERDA